MTYDQKKVDELVSNAKVLESLRDLSQSLRMDAIDVCGAPKLPRTTDEWYWAGINYGLGEVVREIDKRTVTLMERIYAELVYGEVPFDGE